MSRAEKSEVNKKPKTIEDFYAKGFRRVCLSCNTLFEPDKVRKEDYDDGHGGRPIEMCKCGCDLIGHIIKNEDGKFFICREPKIDEDSVPL